MLEETIMATRFGMGLGPHVVPRDAIDLMASLNDRDNAAHPAWALPSTYEAQGLALNDRIARRAMRRGEEGAKTRRKEARRAINNAVLRGRKALIASGLDPNNAFKERLVAFWADHFTAIGRGPAGQLLRLAMYREGIRPHVLGSFSELLRAAALHPAMLVYLDQTRSFGPNSTVGVRRKRGLNENLARELLELHSVGPGATYGAKDIEQFAELLTGLTYSERTGAHFLSQRAEPGSENVLGQEYGGRVGQSIDAIYAALDDLAVHPRTAQHIATKLVRHFFADEPSEAVVERLSRRFLETDGDLRAVYELMLDMGRTAPHHQKIRRPREFICAALNGLGITQAQVMEMSPRAVHQTIIRPLIHMGQGFGRQTGPDGWGETTEDWITPQGLAARIEWAHRTPLALSPQFSDPREVLKNCLAQTASRRLTWAVGAASTHAEGIALVLSSAEFNRR